MIGAGHADRGPAAGLRDHGGMCEFSLNAHGGLPPSACGSMQGLGAWGGFGGSGVYDVIDRPTMSWEKNGL